MSSTDQAASSSTPSCLSNFQLIINAVADYAKQTGIDLAKNPFAEKIELSNSPEAILELLQEREKAFKEYRGGESEVDNLPHPGSDGSSYLFRHSWRGGQPGKLRHLPPFEFINVASSGPLFTGKGCLYRH